MTHKRVITVDDELLAARYAHGLISVVDDDASVLGALEDLIQYEGYACEAYPSVQAFQEAQNQPRFPGPRCILSDMCMPGMDGLALQTQLPHNSDQVLVFMSGMSDVTQVSQAFRRGALHFLTKPINDELLFATLTEALQKSTRLQQELRWMDRQSQLVATLTPRELEVARLIPQGLPIKVMAKMLGVSERAVKIYKQNLMNKLKLESAFDLVPLVEKNIL